MKTIPLSRGQVAIVDDEDLRWLSSMSWCAQWSPSMRAFYAKGGDRTKYHDQSMARCIWQCHHGHIPPGLQVDHINGNTLDNQKRNLRLATPTLNILNCHRPRSRRTDLPEGVRRPRGVTPRYQARFRGKSLGTFDSVEAAKAHHQMAVEKAIADELRKVEKIVAGCKPVLIGPLRPVTFRRPGGITPLPFPTGDGDASTLCSGCVKTLLSRLSYREREVIRLRYGTGHSRSRTLEQCGRIFRVSRERLRQIEAKALRELRWWADKELESSDLVPREPGCASASLPGNPSPAATVDGLRPSEPPVQESAAPSPCTPAEASAAP